MSDLEGTNAQHLGYVHSVRFKRLGEISDLNEAVAYGSQAVSLTPDAHPDKPQRLLNLGAAYFNRFKRIGEVSDLERVIESGLLALSVTPDAHPVKPQILRNLGSAYTTRFEQLGEISDLNEAIVYGSQAASLSLDDHSNKPGALNNLGVAYITRFEHLGELTDPNEAISYGSQAVSLTPGGHPSRPATLTSLAGAYAARFQRLGEISDLDQAVACGSEVVLATRNGDPEKLGGLSILGGVYAARFECLGEISDLNASITYASQAVSLTPDGHPDKPAMLSNLGLAYNTRFECLGEMADLNEAIICGSQAASLTPDRHPDNPARLSSLGVAYRSRFQRLANLSDLRSAVSAFASAAQSPTGPPSVRFNACRHWARLSLLDNTVSPHLAYHQAMTMLPLLVWIGTTLDRRYELIADVGDFCTEATSYAISVNAFGLALEWLEAGRALVWRQITQLRDPFDQLATYDLDLANKLRDVGSKIERTGLQTPSLASVPKDSHDLVHETNSHINLALEWDKLLEQARSTPGCEEFLCPPKWPRLMSAARSHPVAVINCHDSRHDALILQPNHDTILHIPLRISSHETANIARSNLGSVAQRGFKKAGHSGLSAGRSSKQEELLKHLWLGIVKPVLDCLGFIHNLPIDQLPHITWCATGLLSFLPLHAARCYDQPESGTFNRVISSYTPTLSALLTCQSQTPADQCGLVAVGQEHTRGFNRLPCISDKLEVIMQHAEAGIYLQLESVEATVEQVLDAMDQFSWIHMACHGTQNVTDPTQSAFHLHDGPLTLATIASRSYTNKGLAFLSACETATGDKTLPDEVIHLAAGMLMAGFPSVIGTMWGIVDEDHCSLEALNFSALIQ